MRRLNSLCMLVFVLNLLSSCKREEVKREGNAQFAILPAPVNMQLTDGNFSLSADTKIIANDTSEELHAMAAYLSSEINRLVQVKTAVNTTVPADSSNAIFLIIDTTIQSTVNASPAIQKEAYTLAVKPGKVIIRGQTAAALFYGVQTFLQLAYPHEQGSVISIPAMDVQDHPQFSWRGMHMDVCRHFFPVAFVKKMIDALAMHKLNTFHWHLTDDQGWRIEIKKYPKLTSVGGWRKETVIGHMSGNPLKYDGNKYGGFYTQEQIKEVVAYAKSRYITIVPEIEMPGHAVAALSAYPEYSCTGGPFDVFTEWGETKEVFCAGKEKTFTFIEDILDEVTTLFPGTYIHVGGDECSTVISSACADCKQRMKQEKLKDALALQGYFIKRIETYLNSKGKKLIGWDEILDGGLPESATVMSWRGEQGGITASNAGHDVVMTPGKYCYLDHNQGNIQTEPLSIGGYLPLDSVYAYNPLPRGLNAVKLKHILGAQANIWTEYIPTENQFEYMVFPRLCAMAEILWTPKEKQSYSDFTHRMDKHYLRLDKNNILYRINAPVGFNEINRVLKDTTTVSMHNDIPSAEIRYTLDGTEPGKSSTLYTQPFLLSLKDGRKKVMAKSFLPNGKASTSLSGTFETVGILPGRPLTHQQKGITYDYYEQAFSSAENVKGTPTKSGVLDSLNIPAWIPKKKEWFAFNYKGYLKIDKEGLYTFSLNADDGAVLYIDDVLVVDNDGYHYAQEKSGNIGLGEGYHSIRLAYFEGKYTPVLEVKIMCQGLKKQAIPLSMLWHE
jgi:hexosaminidase